jgi:hypothetical protein
MLCDLRRGQDRLRHRGGGRWDQQRIELKAAGLQGGAASSWTASGGFGRWPAADDVAKVLDRTPGSM